MIFAGVLALGPQTPVRPTAKAATFSVCALGCDHTSIQAAVNTADATVGDDIINVQAGTYAETVTIPASEPNLIINGPNFTIHGCTGTRVAEAIVVSATGPFHISANNVTINGFTAQGASSGAFPVSGIVIGVNTTGVKLLNNIIQNNVIGVGLGGDDSTIQANLIQDNNNPGAGTGTGIFASGDHGGGTLTNVLIDDNCLRGNTGYALILNSSTPGFPLNITMSRNVVTGNGSSFTSRNLTNSSITGNTLSGSTVARPDISFFGASGVTIRENVFSNGPDRGIVIGESESCFLCLSNNITINCNSFTNYADDALVIFPGLDSPTGYDGSLNAENNWWGSATGPTVASNPGGTGESIYDVQNQVDYKPFLLSECGCALNKAPALVVGSAGKVDEDNLTQYEFRQQLATIKDSFNNATVTYRYDLPAVDQFEECPQCQYVIRIRYRDTGTSQRIIVRLKAARLGMDGIEQIYQFDSDGPDTNGSAPPPNVPGNQTYETCITMPHNHLSPGRYAYFLEVEIRKTANDDTASPGFIAFMIAQKLEQDSF